MKKKQVRKYPLLSEVPVNHFNRFAYCIKCKTGYENDKSASQVRCPLCGQVMENMSEIALDKITQEIARLRQERIERIEGGDHQ